MEHIKERPKVGNNNVQQRIANATSGGARKPPGPKERERAKVNHYNGPYLSPEPTQFQVFPSPTSVNTDKLCQTIWDVITDY